MKKTTIRQKAYMMQYQKDHVRRINFQLNKTHDADILAFLDTMPSKNSYLKNLVREDMKKRGI